MGRLEWSAGGKWDNCNSIINKYIKKKEKKEPSEFLVELIWILKRGVRCDKRAIKVGFWPV